MDQHLLDILRCPVSGQPLALLGKDKLKQLNAAIAGGRVRQQDGEPVSAPLTEALRTANGSTLYPVRNGIPVMLEDQSISTAQLQDF